jgi:hypothetical protein
MKNNMIKAGIYRHGAMCHRMRDSFADRQLRAGTSLMVLAAAMGDEPLSVQKHYIDIINSLEKAIESAPVIDVPLPSVTTPLQTA